MGNASAKKIECPVDDESIMTADQLELVLRSKAFREVFEENSTVIKNFSEPISLQRNLFYWDNHENLTEYWATCKVKLTPNMWSYGNGTFAENLSFGCGMTEQCCQTDCCYYFSKYELTWILGIVVLFLLLLYFQGKTLSMFKMIKSGIRQERNTQIFQLQEVPRRNHEMRSWPGIPLVARGPTIVSEVGRQYWKMENRRGVDDDAPPTYASLFPETSTSNSGQQIEESIEATTTV